MKEFFKLIHPYQIQNYGIFKQIRKVKKSLTL